MTDAVNNNNNNNNNGLLQGVNAENNPVPGVPIIANRIRPQNQNPLINVRDRLFHALFFKIALAYAKNVPTPVRRFIELFVLLKALAAFFILIYIHIAFSQTPATCLEHVKNDWPRDGILRVEIIPKMTQAQSSIVNEISNLLHGSEVPYGGTVNKDDVKINPSSTIPQELNDPIAAEQVNQPDAIATERTDIIDSSSVVESVDGNPYNMIYTAFLSKPNNLEETHIENTQFNSRPEKGDRVVLYTNETLDSELNENLLKNSIDENERTGDDVTMVESTTEAESKTELDEEVDENDKMVYDDVYIVEYSLEYGFLRLSSSTRQRLKIPVYVVTLDPQKNECFGDPFSRFILSEFLGYDDLLMASVKVLVEQEDNKGYLRNLVTGEHYRFVSMWWMTRGSYLAAFFIMTCFTISISMLLRYSHHQIFVFIVDLLQMLEFNVTVRFPAAPLLTVILALVERRPTNEHRGRYNDPTTNEVAVLLVDEDKGSRDIVLDYRYGKLSCISELHQSYDALEYPLMFARREDRYSLNMPHTNSPHIKTITCMQFYAFRLMVKNGSFNTLHYYKNLFNQYCIDMMAKMISESRLHYIRTNQAKLRAENYVHLRDAVNEDQNIDARNMGQYVILPSTFTGLPRYMHEKTQDAMTCKDQIYSLPLRATPNGLRSRRSYFLVKDLLIGITS